MGTVIERHGDGLLDDSLMPVGWPLNLDGAVKQWCVHRTATFKLTSLLKTYDMKRDLIELNYKTAQWSAGAVWNRRYMEPKTRKSMRQMWMTSHVPPQAASLASRAGEDWQRVYARIGHLPFCTNCKRDGSRTVPS